LLYGSLGQFDKALSAALDEMKADPNSVFSYQDVADSYSNLNRLDEAKTVAEQGLAKFPDAVGIHRQLMDLAYQRGDTAEVNRHLVWAKGRPNEPFALVAKAFYELNEGKLKAALQTLQDAQAAALKFNNVEFSAVVVALSGVAHSLVGDCAPAKAKAAASLQEFPDGVNRGPASVALAVCGEAARATKLIDARVKQYPNDTMLNFVRKPTVLALLSMHAGKPEEALRLLEPARRIELGVGPGAPAGFAAYVRGLIYLNKKDGANAAVEFRKIVDRRYLYGSTPTFALSQLGLARSYVLQSDAAKARTAYQDVLAAWKDADSDLTPLKLAKAEYAKLQ